MKSKEEIEQLATKHYRSNGSGGGQYTEGLQEGRLIGYIDGYKQCQEDMSDKKYTEEDMLFAFVHGGTKFEENKDASMLNKNFKELISSLNKQD